MEPTNNHKVSSVRNLLLRALLLGVSVLLFRFVYLVTVRAGSCDVAVGFCFFPGPESFNLIGVDPALVGRKSFSSSPDEIFSQPSNSRLKKLWTSREWRKRVDSYSSLFQDLIKQGFLSPSSKALCVGSGKGQDVFALKEIGISDSIGIDRKPSLPLVISGDYSEQPFDDETFDFEFSGGGLDRSPRPVEFASEMCRTLKPRGFLVIHTLSEIDLYSLNSFLYLFNCCRVIRTRKIHVDGPGSHTEIVLKKHSVSNILDGHEGTSSLQGPFNGTLINKCPVPKWKKGLVQKAEPLIMEEPLKPWITLKRNIKNIKYLPSMVDISFKRHYVYVDVGARSYGSSIGSWFKKQYPKQNRTFEIFAIEADRAFHEEYSKKKGVKLLPYAAWTKNETLFFEINRDPGSSEDTRGMGRIQTQTGHATDSKKADDRIQGFDFADWLKNTVSASDYVVMKMDVEGTEFDLVPRLFETGAICLIDELFLECHYNRWQRSQPGRSPKYKKTYQQCLELFTSLRDSGVLVHQWW